MTPPTDKEREAAALARLRGVADATAGDRWMIEVNGEEVCLVAGRATGEDALICTIHASALAVERDLLCGALDHLALFLCLFDRAASTVRELRGQAGRKEAEARRKDFAAQAAMLLADRHFQRFLEAKGAGGPVRDKGAADTRLKFVLNISSKSELNSTERGRAAWLELRGEFEAWKRGGS